MYHETFPLTTLLCRLESDSMHIDASMGAKTSTHGEFSCRVFFDDEALVTPINSAYCSSSSGLGLIIRIFR